MNNQNNHNLINSLVEYKPHVAWATLQGRGTEWTEGVEAISSVWDGHVCPVPENKGSLSTDQ